MNEAVFDAPFFVLDMTRRVKKEVGSAETMGLVWALMALLSP